MDFIIDTNAIYGDHFLKNTILETFCKEAKKQGHTVYIPEVVLEEHTKHYEEFLTELRDKAGKELKEFSRFAEPVDNPVTPFVISKSVKKHAKLIHDRAKALGIEILPVPTVGHTSLAKKGIYHKKPFKPSGAGYIDALIWESVKDKCSPFNEYDHLAHPRVILVSKDGDFSEPESFDLHEELVDELILEGVDSVVVQIVADIKTASKATARTDDDLTIADAQKYFSGSGLLNSEVIEKAKKLVMDHVPGESFNNEEIALGEVFENPSVDMFDEDFVFELDNIEVIDADTIWVRLNVSMTLLLDVFIFKADYYLLDDDSGVSVYDHEWNDHYVAAQLEKNIWFTMDLDLNIKDYSIKTHSIEVNEEKNAVALAMP